MAKTVALGDENTLRTSILVLDFLLFLETSLVRVKSHSCDCTVHTHEGPMRISLHG